MATGALCVSCRRSIIASMHRDAVRRDPWPRARTAATCFSDGGLVESWVVARRTATVIEPAPLLIDTTDRVALINEALSLSISMRFRSFFSPRPMAAGQSLRFFSFSHISINSRNTNVDCVNNLYWTRL